MAVTTAISFLIFDLLGCRSLTATILEIRAASNPMIFAGIGTVILLHFTFLYTPLHGLRRRD